MPGGKGFFVCTVVELGMIVDVVLSSVLNLLRCNFRESQDAGVVDL